VTDENSQPRAQSTRTLLVRLVRQYLRPYLWPLIPAVLCMIVAAAGDGILAYLMKPVLDDLFINHDRDMLILIPALVIVVTLLKSTAAFGQVVLMGFIGLRIIADLQTQLFGHVIRFDLAFFHDTASGKLVSRMTNDINLMRNALVNTLTGLVKDSLSLVFLVAVMFSMDWKLALLAFVVFPIAIFPIVRIGRRLRKISTSALNELGLFTARLNEAFQGVRHIKAYNREAFESERTERLIESVFRLIFKALRTRALVSPIMEAIGGVFIALVILYGGWQVIEEMLTPGEFFAFITAMLMAYKPLKALANLNANLQEGLAATQRVFDVLDTEPTITSDPDAAALNVNGGEIIFDDVSFSYNTGTAALNGVLLKVPAGRTVALVGPSGAGKSTILNLLPRFYDADGGQVTIDGTDVRDVDLTSLRNAIGLVSQETVLFDDSVRANIAYGRLDASEAEIIAAAEGADAHDFIRNLPDGYDTLIGEHGAKLSGGQRQRLSIARAMLKDAPILLLDEATSALDPETERQIQQSLRHLMQDRTTLVIAHRLTTVQEADIIYFIKDGRVAESGSHHTLMAKDGAYARLYALELVPASEIGDLITDDADD
jgi:subfamily B ATP-binding cassette protein MsbA